MPSQRTPSKSSARMSGMAMRLFCAKSRRSEISRDRFRGRRATIPGVAKRYRLGIGRRSVNALVRALLRLGVGPARTYLLVTRGRTTGRVYRTPVTLVEDGPRRWLVAPYGEVAWVKNARAAGQVMLERGRQSDTQRLLELPPRESAP